MINNVWKVLRISSSVALFSFLGACALFTGDDGRYDPTPLKEYPAGVSAQMGWQAQLGSGSSVGFVPMIVQSAVYAATMDGAVGKFDIATGAAQWRVNVGSKLSAGVGSDGVITAVAAVDGTIIALDDAGVEKWRSRATSDVTVPPVVGFGVVVVRSGDYRIQGFNADTGERIWSVQRPGPALALRTPSRMVVLEGLVITGVPGGKMLAINVRSGDVQWEGVVAVAKGSTDLERVTDVTGSPLLLGPLLCAGAYQGRVACFDVSQGGRLVWGKDFSTPRGIGLDTTNVYAGDLKDILVSFAIPDGSQSWKQESLKYRKLTAPASNGKVVAVGDFEGFVHLLSATDGKMLGRIATGGGEMFAPPQATSQGMLVQLGNGNLALIVLN
jgi:outer membrane protein assembly factor BamB